MRILVLQDVEQWSGAIAQQAYLEIPDKMDIAIEEKRWFSQGGGTLKDFVDHLVAKGAKELTTLETWTINYQ